MANRRKGLNQPGARPAAAQQAKTEKYTTEAGLQAGCTAWLDAQHAAGVPVFYFKAVGSMYQEPGIPDLIICWYGLFIGIELKCPGKNYKTQNDRRSIVQRRKIEDIRHACGAAEFINSYQDFVNFMDNLRKEVVEC